MEKRNYNLVGQDGNAFALMAYTQKAMKECGRSKEQIDEVLKKAKGGNYDNLLVVLDDEIQKLNNGDDFENNDYYSDRLNPYGLSPEEVK